MKRRLPDPRGELVVPVRAAGVAERPDGRELELSLPVTRRTLRLNPSARAIWSACDGRRDARALSLLLEGELGLPAGTLLADVREALDGLAAHGALRLERRGSASEPREVVRVFVGTGRRHHKAALALEESLREHTPDPVELVWMDPGRGEPWSSWRAGAGEAGRACFRYAVPELAGFRGRAIYLESAVLVRRDLRELLELPASAPWLDDPRRRGVVRIDCEAFADAAWWPQILWMQSSGWGDEPYRALLERHGALGGLPARWDTPSAGEDALGRAAVLHFAEPELQPWMPHPERHAYRTHPSERVLELWWSTYLAARRRAAASSASPARAAVAVGG